MFIVVKSMRCNSAESLLALRVCVRFADLWLRLPQLPAFLTLLNQLLGRALGSLKTQHCGNACMSHQTL